LEAAQADAKAKGKKFNVFRVTSPAALNKPERFYTSNHRNAVQYSVMVRTATASPAATASAAGNSFPAIRRKRLRSRWT
jgi:fructose-specific component phosphotransferase system IIB-like protein